MRQSLPLGFSLEATPPSAYSPSGNRICSRTTPGLSGGGHLFCHFIRVFQAGQGIPMGTHLEPVLLALRILPRPTSCAECKAVD